MDTGLTVFDCYATIGPRQNMASGERHTLAHLEESMDRCGIDAALVSSTFALNYDPMWGNRHLCAEIAGNPRLFPLWVALPHHAGECPPPAEFVREARAAGVRAVRLYPRAHGYATDPGTLGPLLSELASAGMPVLISKDQFGSAQAELGQGFERLDEFLGRYSDNAFVVTDLWWSEVRYVLPMLEKRPNLHIEFSSFQVNMAPEFLTKRFGAERFLLGTGAPHKSPGAARALIDWADLPDTARRQIAGGNLRRLLGVDSLPKVVKRPADDIVAAQWQGRPVDMIEVLDAHAHVGHQGGNGVGGMCVQLESGAADMRRLFRRIGIQRTAVSSWLGIMMPEPWLGNDLTLAAMREAPDFIIGYAEMDANLMSDEDMAREIALRYGEQGFRGLKPYIRTLARFDDPRYERWYRYGDEHRLFVLFHDQHAVAGKLASTYPGLNFLLAHCGGSIGGARASSEIAAQAPNIFCEITLTPVTNGAIELMVDRCGPEKVLFGTDAPMRDPRPQLGWAVHADLPRAAKVRVLGANFAGILAGCR